MFIFSGEVSPHVDAIEIAIYKPKGNKALYKSQWQKSQTKDSETFRVSMNYRLQGNAEYDIRFTYFEKLDKASKAAIQQEIEDQISYYLKQHTSEKKEHIQLNKSASQINNDLNNILLQGLAGYRHSQGEVASFSNMMEEQIKGLEGIATNQQVEMLVKLLSKEVNKLLRSDWWEVVGKREVKNYPTEKIPGVFALNLGYGGALINGDADNFSYSNGPYVGVSIPLSNRSYVSPLLKNTSISLGAFTDNFEDPNGKVYTGPIFGRPYYAGLGYSIFRFVRVNAGVVAMEEVIEDGNNGGNFSLNLDRIKLQPFIGVCAEIRFSGEIK
jgi:hypothetical protein